MRRDVCMVLSVTNQFSGLTRRGGHTPRAAHEARIAVISSIATLPPTMRAPGSAAAPSPRRRPPTSGAAARSAALRTPTRARREAAAPLARCRAPATVRAEGGQRVEPAMPKGEPAARSWGGGGPGAGASTWISCGPAKLGISRSSYTPGSPGARGKDAGRSMTRAVAKVRVKRAARGAEGRWWPMRRTARHAHGVALPAARRGAAGRVGPAAVPGEKGVHLVQVFAQLDLPPGRRGSTAGGATSEQGGKTASGVAAGWRRGASQKRANGCGRP